MAQFALASTKHKHCARMEAPGPRPGSQPAGPGHRLQHHGLVARPDTHDGIRNQQPIKQPRRNSLALALEAGVRPGAIHIEEGLKDLSADLEGRPRPDKLQLTKALIAEVCA